MKKTVTLTVILVSLLSCNFKSTALFELKNESGYQIDSLKIEASGVANTNYVTIASGGALDYEVDMTHTPKTDGHYIITYIIHGKSKSTPFGYYTNGTPLEVLQKIKITKDSLIFDAEFKKY
ncbi:hypothetical protein [Costertonia aggregata]|uniref:Uncharacterized protein n=1 Tax=Costertonia aggregata TaxID=343403 RepID=A0A7H9APA3_9FLAO|nr:hypothetical protein [Costertonia aggregata]QLG45213.1 hypothetical protein HYG79_07575 [Costertonia aggregata]